MCVGREEDAEAEAEPNEDEDEESEEAREGVPAMYAEAIFSLLFSSDKIEKHLSQDDSDLVNIHRDMIRYSTRT